MKTWTLDEGLEFIRRWQPVFTEKGWNLSLGGGVLNKGESLKDDLDIVVAPAKDRRPEIHDLTEFITDKWPVLRKRRWNVYMDLIKTEVMGKEVDWFIVTGPARVE